MSLEDRIEDEMVVDTESILDDNFDRANELFRIFQDGSIDLTDELSDASWRDKVLAYLLGQQYAHVAGKVDSPSLPYNYFYSRFEVDDSTVRKYMGQLQDDLIVKKYGEDDEWTLVTDNLPEALNRIEGLES
jgi:hypothetical protein